MWQSLAELLEMGVQNITIPVSKSYTSKTTRGTPYCPISHPEKGLCAAIHINPGRGSLNFEILLILAHSHQ